MFLWSATLGAALAEPDGEKLQLGGAPAAWRPRTTRISAGAGVDIWSANVLPIQSVRVFLDDTPVTQPVVGSWSYTGDLAIWGLQSALDLHTLSLSAGLPGSEWQLAVNGQASAAMAWSDLHVGPVRNVEFSGGNAALMVGAAGRRGGGLGSLGPTLGLDLGAYDGRRSLFLSADLHYWPAKALPRTVTELDTLFVWEATPQTTVLAGLGLTAAWTPGAGPAADLSAWSPGLPPVGSLSLRQLTAVEQSLGRRGFLRAEIGAQELIGAQSIAHLTATGGGGVRLYQPDRTPDFGPGPFKVELNVEAPDASTVMVMGSFTQWRPVPLWSRGSGRWTIELSLTSGQYEYVYLVDGVLITPPESEVRRDDGFGGQNGVLLVPMQAVSTTPISAPPSVTTPPPQLQP